MYLGLEHPQPPHHHRFAAHGLERGPAAKRECGPDGDAIDGHLKIGAREAVAVSLTGNGGGLFHRPIDLLPVDLLSAGGSGDGQRRSTSGKHLNSTHDWFLLDGHTARLSFSWGIPGHLAKQAFGVARADYALKAST